MHKLGRGHRDKLQQFITITGAREAVIILNIEKFNISDKGEKAVFTRINDAWRRYKSFIKKKHFSKYSTLKDRLKHRPLFLSEAHFKQLLKYWNISTIQSISERNAANRAKQKYIHRMGPTSFARIHAELRTKKEVGEKVTQAEMFITTRQRREGRKGKELDEETHNAIVKKVVQQGHIHLHQPMIRS
ncbi:putative transposase [Vigna unguiculata]|uniref:Putative transposase n=1 Tax=Vigna unguiculata TaxID=3917 RepID=A0A4D6L1R9_VIGUN|nr:putative transposase [Vigna unguiculata]